MLKLVATGVLLIIAFLSIGLNKTYKQLPTIELKRRARKHDKTASRLYRVAVYEKELSILLWLVIILSAAGALVLIISSLSAWLSFVVVVLLLWLGFAWLPFLNISPVNYLATKVAAPLAWIIDSFHPIITKLVVLSGHLRIHPSRLYQIEDLLEVLDRQTLSPDNRIPKERLDIAARVLTFGDVIVNDTMIPWRLVVVVNSHDSIGPVLMGELHSSGHSRFPVYDGKQSNIVGTLYMRDVVDIKKGGSVSSVMKKEVYYVHEEQTLEQTLHAFLKTKHHLFMVVNKFEEIIGIITIEDVIEQILGRPIVGEFDKYEDLRAVAASLAKKEHVNKTTEVIE